MFRNWGHVQYFLFCSKVRNVSCKLCKIHLAIHFDLRYLLFHHIGSAVLEKYTTLKTLVGNGQLGFPSNTILNLARQVNRVLRNIPFIIHSYVATTIEITTTIEIIISIVVENTFKTTQSVAHYWKNDHYWNNFYYWNSYVFSTLL